MVNTSMFMFFTIIFGYGVISTYGQKNVTGGVNCNVNNSMCCANYWKNDNGDCVECLPGTYGIECKQICPRGYFGNLCRSECFCKKHETCVPTIGCLCTNCTERDIDIQPATYVLITFASLGSITTFVVVGVLLYFRNCCRKKHQLFDNISTALRNLSPTTEGNGHRYEIHPLRTRGDLRNECSGVSCQTHCQMSSINDLFKDDKTDIYHTISFKQQTSDEMQTSKFYNPDATYDRLFTPNYISAHRQNATGCYSDPKHGVHSNNSQGPDSFTIEVEVHDPTEDSSLATAKYEKGKFVNTEQNWLAQPACSESTYEKINIAGPSNMLITDQSKILEVVSDHKIENNHSSVDFKTHIYCESQEIPTQDDKENIYMVSKHSPNTDRTDFIQSFTNINECENEFEKSGSSMSKRHILSENMVDKKLWDEAGCNIYEQPISCTIHDLISPQNEKNRNENSESSYRDFYALQNNVAIPSKSFSLNTRSNRNMIKQNKHHHDHAFTTSDEIQHDKNTSTPLLSRNLFYVKANSLQNKSLTLPTSLSLNERPYSLVKLPNVNTDHPKIKDRESSEAPLVFTLKTDRKSEEDPYNLNKDSTKNKYMYLNPNLPHLENSTTGVKMETNLKRKMNGSFETDVKYGHNIDNDIGALQEENKLNMSIQNGMMSNVSTTTSKSNNSHLNPAIADQCQSGSDDQGCSTSSIISKPKGIPQSASNYEQESDDQNVYEDLNVFTGPVYESLHVRYTGNDTGQSEISILSSVKKTEDTDTGTSLDGVHTNQFTFAKKIFHRARKCLLNKKNPTK